jgi:hypothetical protein
LFPGTSGPHDFLLAGELFMSLRAARKPAAGFRVMLVVAVFALAGCGKPSATISGTVKYKGQPIPSGTIRFIGKDDNGKEVMKEGKITDGSFSVAGLPPGKIKVGVISSAGKPSSGMAPGWTEAMSDAQKAEMQKKFSDPAVTKSGSGGGLEIPPVYADPNQSGETLNVEVGKNEVAIDLKETNKVLISGKIKGKKGPGDPWKNQGH